MRAVPHQLRLARRTGEWGDRRQRYHHALANDLPIYVVEVQSAGDQGSFSGLKKSQKDRLAERFSILSVE